MNTIDFQNRISALFGGKFYSASDIDELFAIVKLKTEQAQDVWNSRNDGHIGESLASISTNLLLLASVFGVDLGYETERAIIFKERIQREVSMSSTPFLGKPHPYPPHHIMYLDKDSMEKVRNRTKTIEIMLVNTDCRDIKLDDEIRFHQINDKSEYVSVRVIALHTAKSFSQLLSTVPISKCGYCKQTDISEICRLFDKEHSTKEQFANGVIGIEFEVCSN